MSVKTSFPTHATLPESKKTKLNSHSKKYLLYLKGSLRQSSIDSVQTDNSNIFKGHIRTLDDQDRNKRPIGGYQLMRKVQINNGPRQRKKTKSTIKGHDSLNLLSMKTNQTHRLKTEIAKVQQVERRNRLSTSIDPHEQTLKEHKIYNSVDHLSNNNKISLAPNKIKGRWKNTQKQRKDYLDKSALLDQIAFNRPLKHQAGNEYFQLLVRDRWKQQLKSNNYIYQLRPNEPFSNNKTILKLRKQFPTIKQRKALLLRGRLLTTLD